MLENITILDDIRSIMEQNLALRAQLQSAIEQGQKIAQEGKQLIVDYKQKLVDLEGREQLVKDKEAKIHTFEEIQQLRNALDEQAAQITNDRLACDRECAEKRGEIANELADLDSKLKDLDAREKSLEQDKKTYKETLLRKMGKDPKCN